MISVPTETQISMETFHKWKNGFIGGFNDKNRFGVDISKVGHDSSKGCIDSCFLVRIIFDQGEAIGILHQTI